MATQASDQAKKMAGTYVEDDKSPKAPTLSFLQEQCRTGVLRTYVEEFVKAQDEDVDPGLVLVDSFTPELISCRIPGKVADRENTSTFPLEVLFSLNPATGTAVRL